MNLIEDLTSRVQEHLIGGATQIVTTGASATPAGFLRNPNAPEDTIVSGVAAGQLYPFNHGFFQTGVNGLAVQTSLGYTNGQGNWRQPGQSGVTIVWGDAPTIP